MGMTDKKFHRYLNRFHKESAHNEADGEKGEACINEPVLVSPEVGFGQGTFLIGPLFYVFASGNVYAALADGVEDIDDLVDDTTGKFMGQLLGPCRYGYGRSVVRGRLERAVQAWERWHQLHPGTAKAERLRLKMEKANKRSWDYSNLPIEQQEYNTMVDLRDDYIALLHRYNDAVVSANMMSAALTEDYHG